MGEYGMYKLSVPSIGNSSNSIAYIRRHSNLTTPITAPICRHKCYHIPGMQCCLTGACLDCDSADRYPHVYKYSSARAHVTSIARGVPLSHRDTHHFLQAGISHVDHRFHTTTLVWNPELTWEIPTASWFSCWSWCFTLHQQHKILTFIKWVFLWSLSWVLQQIWPAFEQVHRKTIVLQVSGQEKHKARIALQPSLASLSSLWDSRSIFNPWRGKQKLCLKCQQLHVHFC